MDRALSTEQVAERLGVNARTVRRVMREDADLKAIAYFVRGTKRVDSNDLEAWIAKRKQQAKRQAGTA